MEEWTSYLLSDLADIVTGKTPSTKIESYFGGGIHFITPGDINKGLKHIISTDRTLTNAGLNSIKGSMIEPNSICVSCIGNIGYVGMATMECATNQQINSLVVKSGFDADFVYYLMKYLWPEFKNFEGQSTTLSILNKGLFSKIEVKVPSLNTQECIAKLLSSFDDKIELNNRINHNLEEQAQALYKSWCVCFDPYKSGGFIDSELGPIPHGWQVIPLKDIVDYKKKSVNPQKSPDTWFVHYSLPAFDNAKEPEIQKGASIMSNKFLLEGKTVLFSKLNPRIKRIWPIEKTTPNSICSTEFIVYKAKNESLHPFVWCLLNGDYFYDKVLSEVNGATGSHQRFHADDTLDYVIPFNLETAIRLSEKVAPMLQSIIEKEDEIRVLKAKRDALLSKLMSGELKLTC